MSTVELTSENENVSVEVELDHIARELGKQYITSGDYDNYELPYLAALALETYDDRGYQAHDTVMEFIRNSSAFENVDADACDQIELLLQ